MDFHYLHLLTNHIPIVGMPIALCLLVFGLFMVRPDLKKAAYALLFVMGVMTIPVYFTGEPAEEKVEDTPLVSESVLEEHESIAEVAFYLCAITGLFGLAGVWLENKRANAAYTRNLPVIVMLVTLASSGLLAWTAMLGGKIRRPELRGEGIEPVGSEVDDFEEVGE